MPLPKIETTPEKSAQIDYSTNLNNLDHLIDNLNVDKQKFTPPETSKTYIPGIGTEPIAFDPLTDLSKPQTKTDPEKAKRTGKITAETLDYGIASGCGLIAKTTKINQYKADEEDIKVLSNAWAEISEVYGYNIPPWIQIAILYPSIYTPKLIQASQDRRFNIVNNELTNVKQRLEDLEIKKSEKEAEMNV